MAKEQEHEQEQEQEQEQEVEYENKPVEQNNAIINEEITPAINLDSQGLSEDTDVSIS